MWARGFLLAIVCVGGVAALLAGLLPRESVMRPETAIGPYHEDAEIARVVERLDAQFHQTWRDADIVPAATADDLAVARRLSLALTGAIPSLEEIRLLEARQPEHRVGWWTARLLHDRRYADHVAERLARAYVGVIDGPFLVFRRRRFTTWLSDQLHDGRRYDAVVRELITAEGLWTEQPATNFVTVTINPDADEEGPDENKLAARVTRAFLGLRLDCAECHDHPFQDWQQRDFQGLAAFFARTEMSATGVREGNGELTFDDYDTGARKIIRPSVPFHEDLLATGEHRRRRLARWVTHPHNKAFARATINRIWALLFSRPLVEPIDDIPFEGSHPAALEMLAEDFVRHDFDLRRLIRVIAQSEAFRVDSRANPALIGHKITDAHAQLWAAFPLTRLRPEQVVGAVQQAASLTTIDHESHILARLARSIGQSEFIERYGDPGEDEFVEAAGTIPQRLLLINGQLVKDETADNLFTNASTQIAALAPDDRTAVESSYLAVLSRRPTAAEQEHFLARLAADDGGSRSQRLEDLFWTLINSTEFSWNH